MLKCLQNMGIIFDVKFCISVINFTCVRIGIGYEVWDFFTLLPGIFFMECSFGYMYGKTYKVC